MANSGVRDELFETWYEQMRSLFPRVERTTAKSIWDDGWGTGFNAGYREGVTTARAAVEEIERNLRGDND